MLDVIVQGGTVVTPTGADELDIGILGERISVISAGTHMLTSVSPCRLIGQGTVML